MSLGTIRRSRYFLMRRTWRGNFARGGHTRVAMVGRYWENGRRHDEERCSWVSPGASTNLISTPEEGDHEECDYENFSAMQHDKGHCNIQSAITMPVDTLGDRLFP